MYEELTDAQTRTELGFWFGVAVMHIKIVAVK